MSNSDTKKSTEALPAFGTLIRVPETDDDCDEKPVLRRKKMKRNVTSFAVRETKSRTEKEETNEENGVWWLVNKNGFPIDEITWSKMWDHVSKVHPEGVKMTRTIRGNAELPQVPFPVPPINFSPTLSVLERLEKIQHYMNLLQYNHTGTQFFEIRKNRPLTGLMECAKDMIRESLPIKCLEAVILGLYLTNGMMGVERFPISFKTAFNGNVHRHVVLGMYHSGRYGALGMSRREDLMYKPLLYKSLSEVVLDFEKSYKKYWHEVKKIKIGLPVPHDSHSYEFIQWKTLVLTRSKLTQQEVIKEVDTHSKLIRSKAIKRDSESPLPMYSSRKAKSWSLPQGSSPRKSLSFVDLESAKHSKFHSVPQHSSLTQAIKVYQGSGSATRTSAEKKREHTDLGEYQIRI